MRWLAAPTTIMFDHYDQTRFRAGSLQLVDDGTRRMGILLCDAAGNEQDLQDHGRFTRSGDRLSFEWCGEGHADADLTFAQ